MPTAARKPFAAPAYDLGPIALDRVSGAEAETLGAGLAAIDPWRRLNFAATALNSYLTRNDPAAYRFAVRQDGVLVGVIAVREPWLRGPYLELLGLLPPAQGQGFGAILMDWFEAEAPPGAANLWVLCSDFNTKAIAFYERRGFQRQTALDGLVAEGSSEILLRKPLAGA